MDTAFEIIFYLFYGLGGFISWIAKGRRPKLEDEVSDKHKFRNSVIAIVILIILIGLLIYFVNRT
jgi:hypothetical protein